MKKGDASPVQLYTLLGDLEKLVPNESDLGVLSGYVVIDALFDFKTKSGSKDEIRFEEVKKVYSRLNELINECKQNKNSLAYLSAKAKFEENIQPLLETTSIDKKLDRSGTLIVPILEYLSRRRGSIDDSVRKIGINLYYHIIHSTGKQDRSVDALTQDYQAIKTIFTGLMR